MGGYQTREIVGDRVGAGWRGGSRVQGPGSRVQSPDGTVGLHRLYSANRRSGLACLRKPQFPLRDPDTLAALALLHPDVGQISLAVSDAGSAGLGSQHETFSFSGDRRDVIPCPQCLTLDIGCQRNNMEESCLARIPWMPYGQPTHPVP